MTYITRLILTFGIVLSFYTVFGQNKFNDLYFASLKGKVKSVSTTTINFDSTSWAYGYDKKNVTNYNKKGNCFSELEYLDTNVIQTRVNVFKTINGRNQRIQKITTHAVDTSNKTISYYYFDEIGFDTMIVVCDLDSSYHMRYEYERNVQGLRTKGTEYNAKNGNKNHTFEICYSKDLKIDSIIYRDGYDRINYIEYSIYDINGELVNLKYSTGGMTLFLYLKKDDYGNWIEKETYFEKDGTKELVTRQIRKIEYY
jgi:hypothetical protein